MNDDTDDDPSTDDEKKKDRGIGILDVKAALESVFKGCPVKLTNAISMSFHAEVSFYEYEIRVILSGTRHARRTMHYRFMQRVEQPGSRKPTKRVILEVETKEPEELLKAVENTKAHLLGVVYAIQKAMRPPNVPKVSGVEDLF